MSMNEVFAPRRTDKPEQEISLTGSLIPWDGEVPAFLEMPMSASIYLPCFTNQDKLKSFMDRAKVPFEKIKQIDNGLDFLESLSDEFMGKPLQVIVNPYFTPENRVRFIQVQR